MRLFCYIYLIAAALSMGSCKKGDGSKQSSTPNTEGGQDVSQLFAKQYPSAQDVVWDTLDIGWVANFTDGKNECKAFYDLKRSFQYTTTLIPSEDIPLAIKQDLDKRYKNYTIAIIQEVFDGKAKLIQVEIETDKEYIALEFDDKGRFLKEIKQALSTEEIQRQEEEGVDDDTDNKK